MTSTFDPLATCELIIEGYQRYLKSLLPVRDARIAAALENEIARSLLTKGPLLESSPPYDPSQPATASTSTPNAHRISLVMGLSRLSSCGRANSSVLIRSHA